MEQKRISYRAAMALSLESLTGTEQVLTLDIGGKMVCEENCFTI